MPRDTVLREVTIIDTETGKASPACHVLLRDGKIAAIEQGAPPPGDATVVDARGKFLVPGFVDMHVHSMQDPDPSNSLTMLLAHGVTGIRQMAGAPELLEQRRSGALDYGPESPECLAMPGSLLTFANCPTPEAGVAEVRRQKEQGADFIKSIFVSAPTFFATLAEARKLGLAYGGHLSPGVDVIAASDAGLGFIEHLGPTELQLIACSRAEFVIKLLLRLKPPAPPPLSPAQIQGMVGKIMIANPILFRMKIDPKAVEKTARLVKTFRPEKAKKLAAACARNGTWQCPTLIRNETMQFGDEPRYTECDDLRFVPASVRALWTEVSRQYAEKLDPAARETMKQLREVSFELLRILDAGGVGLLAGSDYGGGWVIPGISLHQEFDLLAEAGLSPLKVLQMTTVLAARFLKREDTMGTVSVGKEANLVLLDGDPVQSVAHLHKIHAVVRDGRYYAADKLREMKEQVAERVAAQ